MYDNGHSYKLHLERILDQRCGKSNFTYINSQNGWVCNLYISFANKSYDIKTSYMRKKNHSTEEACKEVLSRMELDEFDESLNKRHCT